MEVLIGPPSFTIQVASSSSFVRDRTAASPLPPPPPDHALDSPWNCFNSFRTYAVRKAPEDEIDYRSDSSSSIGVPDGDESEDESISSTGGDQEEEVRSKLDSGFASLGSLEESLPIKRGLSSHFSGKLKSFANLAEAKSVKDIVKPENSFNKRRRILIASKLAKKSSFYTWPNPKSMPLLALREVDDDDGDEEEKKSPASYSSEDNEDEDEEPKVKRVSDFHRRRLMSFKSRCFSLADLHQRHHDQPQEH